MNIDGVSEVAAAVKETAIAAQAGFKCANDLGKFLARHVDGILEQTTGYVVDHLKHAREMNLIKFREKLDNQMTGVEVHRKTSLKFGLRVMDMASVEDDESLQERWAKLLKNSIDASNPTVPKQSYISILEDLSSADACVFEKIYSISKEDGIDGVLTSELPNRGIAAKKESDLAEVYNSAKEKNSLNTPKKDAPIPPTQEIILSLSNLKRLGLISMGITWGGNDSFDRVNHTVIGWDFYESIK